eukprot:gene9313-10296_t
MADAISKEDAEASHIGAVEVANHLLERFGSARRIKSIKDFADDYFVVLYEALTTEPLEGVNRQTHLSEESRARNCQIVIDTLARDVLDTDLSHITGIDIVNGNAVSISNLLEIFMDLLECVFDDLQHEEALECNADDQDSNILSEDHDILFDVIQEEFGERSTNKSRDIQSKRQTDSQQNHSDMNKYLVMKEQPRDDPESQSCLDFTADSLFSMEGRKTVVTRRSPTGDVGATSVPNAVQMPPFAYFSSSSSSTGSHSAENPTKEPITCLNKTNTSSGNKDSSTLISSKTKKGQGDDRRHDQSISQKPRSNAPPFTSTMHSDKKEASISSGSWPSILSANELNTPSAKLTSFVSKGEGKKLKAGSSRDANRSAESDASSQGSSVVHKHTHHHYYHCSEPKDARSGTKLSKKSRNESSIASKPESRLSSSVKPNPPSSSLATAEPSKLLPGDLIMQEKHDSIISKSACDKKIEKNVPRTHDSSEYQRKDNHKVAVASNKSHDGTRGRSKRQDGSSKQYDATDKKFDHISTNTSVVGSKAGPSNDGRAHPIRVRSVQTSVSGMPGLLEPTPDTAIATTTKQSSTVSQQQQNNNETASTNSGDTTGRSVLSSVSELNDLLNMQPGKKISQNSHGFDVLRELETKLKEVRASVAKIEDAEKNDRLQEEEDKIMEHRRFLDEDDSRLSAAFCGRKADSIHSDSELDYGDRHVGFHAAEREYGFGKARCKEKIKVLNETSESSCNEDEILSVEIQPRRKKKVAFKDTEKESRDERLGRLVRLLKTEEKENKEELVKVKGKYSKDLKEIKDKYAGKRKENKSASEKNAKPETQKPLLKITQNRSASKLAKIYGASSRSRKLQKTPTKPRKRSASSSPVPRARRRGRLVLEEEDIIPVMEEEFPHLYLSPVTARLMWQKQMHQISNLTKAAELRKPTRIQKQIDEAKKKQDALMNIMRKELEHNKRMKDTKEKAQQQKQVKMKLRERRLASARARRYYDDYQLRMRARMLKRRTKEEKIFKGLFDDALEIQKQRPWLSYRDRFSMMAETMSRERYELQVRQKAQNKVAEKMRKAIRQRMEHDIRALQEELVREEDSTYFRQLDAENLKKEFQLATYKTHF